MICNNQTRYVYGPQAPFVYSYNLTTENSSRPISRRLRKSGRSHKSRRLQQFRSRRLFTAVIAELLGTFLLVLVACGSCVDPGDFSLIRIALCFGFSVASIVWSIGNVSGGHINPAVTVGFLAARRITWVRALLYILAQVAGAVLGAAFLDLLTPNFENSNLCTPGVSPLYSDGQAFGVELIVSFVHVFVVFSAVDGQRGDIGGSVPLTVGITISMCHLMAIPMTGSSMNPARAFGPALVSNTWKHQWLYWIGPLIGGAIAGILYDFVFAVNSTPAKLRGYFTLGYNNDNYNKDGRKSDDITENETE